MDTVLWYLFAVGVLSNALAVVSLVVMFQARGHIDLILDELYNEKMSVTMATPPTNLRTGEQAPATFWLERYRGKV